ncbi:MAG: hypothetical protein ACRENX_07095 [Candidatus Dormibacteria bacterium]
MTKWSKKIDAITLFVEDLDRSVSYYRGFLDQEPDDRDETGATYRPDNLFLRLNVSSDSPTIIAPATVGAAGQGPRMSSESSWTMSVGSATSWPARA